MFPEEIPRFENRGAKREEDVAKRFPVVRFLSLSPSGRTPLETRPRDAQPSFLGVTGDARTMSSFCNQARKVPGETWGFRTDDRVMFRELLVKFASRRG